MSPLATRPRPAPLQHGWTWATALTGVAVAALTLLVVVPATRPPSVVDGVTIVNPHAWSVEVSVTGREGDGWTGVGTVGREQTQTFEEVMDQGRSWIFRFSYGGVDGGELVVSRGQLERARWTITVPEVFSARMRAAGIEPSKR
jgi:hypothetical protein